MSAVLKNNISVNNTLSNYNITFTAGSTNNLSSNSHGAGANVFLNKKVEFINPAEGDLRLKPTSFFAIDKGVDLSADTHISFSTDVLCAKSYTIRPYIEGAAYTHYGL